MGLKNGTFAGRVLDVDAMGNPVKASGSTKGWAVATTAADASIATTVSSRFLNVHNLLITSNVTTRVQVSSAATTITPLMHIAAGSPIHLFSDVHGLAPLRGSNGGDIRLVIPAGEAGMGTGAIITAFAVTTATTT